jgi:hypothetical protein
MQSKKRVHLQQFGIIHLPNPDLTYIRNPERNKIMFAPFHLLKTLHKESFSILYFLFHPPTYRETTMTTTIRARIYTPGEVNLSSFDFCQVGLPNYWRLFFLILLKLYGCQVRLPNHWSCSSSAATGMTSEFKYVHGSRVKF